MVVVTSKTQITEIVKTWNKNILRLVRIFSLTVECVEVCLVIKRWWWWSRVVQEQEWMWMIWQTQLPKLRWGSIHLYCVILVGLGCNLFFTGSLHGGWIQSIASDENKHRKRSKSWQTWWVLQLSPSLKIVPGTPCLGIKAFKSSMFCIVTNSLFYF